METLAIVCWLAVAPFAQGCSEPMPLAEAMVILERKPGGVLAMLRMPAPGQPPTTSDQVPW